jgi:DNA-binding beta-propeller fold protein YncE
MRVPSVLRNSIQRAAFAAVLGFGLVSQMALAQPVIEATHKVAHGGIYELVYNPASNGVLVAAAGMRGAENPGRIVELDAVTLQQRKEYDVSSAPFYGLALNSRTQVLYGSATRSGSVEALDLASGKIIASIGEDAHTRQLVVDEASNKVYVSVVGTRNPNAETQVPSELWVIDGNSNTLAQRFLIAGALTGLAIDGEANRAYMTDMNSNEVLVVDLSNGDVVNRWPTGGESSINVAYDKASSRLFVAAQGSGTLTVLNSQTGELLAKVETGAGAHAVLFNAASNQIYVTNRQASTTTVVDGTTYDVIVNLESGTLPQSLTIDTNANIVFANAKARGLPRNAPADAVPVVDENGDTVVRIRP